MYSVEWQKRGLPHTHILIWLLNKLHSNEVDDIISAEIPDPVTDPHLHDIVTKQMVHGPCGALNPLSPCMADGKCTKRYPRPLVAETVTENDGYPVYRRRSKEDIMVELSKLKFKIKRLRSEINSLYHIVRCYHEFSKHMQTLRVVIRPNQSNICASTLQKAATWLCLVLHRKMRMTKSATSKWADTSVLMKHCGDYCHFKFMKDIPQLYI